MTEKEADLLIVEDEEALREVYAEGKGLPFIVDACTRLDGKATFFVEALGATLTKIGQEWFTLHL